MADKDDIKNYPLAPEEAFEKDGTFNGMKNSKEGVSGWGTPASNLSPHISNRKTGRKDSQEKAPVYTFCLQFKNAIKELALRSKYGHEKYKEQDADWKNFSRVENPDYEYGNAEFRHALGIGDDEDEHGHKVAEAWNAIAKLEMFLQNNLVEQ